MILRLDGRTSTELRRIEIRTNFTKWAEGSVLCCFGDTQVLCTASVEERLPGWLKDQGKGWITAEYSMLPRATDKRSQREAVQGKQGGRTHEISRLIGRSLRAAINLQQLGERSITLDCDVIQADGGTRTAAITGSWVALSLAVQHLMRRNVFAKNPIHKQVAAVSLGVWRKEVVLDLDFKEDQEVDTDLNLVMTNDGGIIEVQGTAEKAPLTRPELNQMMDLGAQGIQQLFMAQKAALEPK